MQDINSIEVPPNIGPYKILKALGAGGMGEVFLGYDSVCDRQIAIKRIRKELQKDQEHRERFLNEARLTSQFSHPAIVPIYTIVDEEEMTYFTMPYIEGTMLKDIFTLGCTQERERLQPDYLTTVPALSYIFLEICHAVAYAHAKGIIHRDLKPSNIMVGIHGQTVILDWGLAKSEVQEKEDKASPKSQESEVKKVAGTLIYTAPELHTGEPASFQTEIYSLGLILYQMLTLRYPFHRSNMEDYRQNMDKEILVDPAKAAPQRNISPILSQITLKCLAESKQDRYPQVEELIWDLENYLKNHSAWFTYPQLDLSDPSVWNSFQVEEKSFKELISTHSLSPVFRVEADIKVDETCSGIGFLLGISDPNISKKDQKAYFLWIGTEFKKNTFLRRLNKSLIETEEIFLTSHQSHHLLIEKIKGSLYFYLNGVLQLSYIDYVPQNGCYFGIIYDKQHTLIENLIPSIFGDGFQANHLAVGNAFLESKNYSLAIEEYDHVANVFPYGYEGNKAIFQAGITLLDESSNISDANIRQEKEKQAFEVFSRLHGAPGAPLEYLGKAQYYRAKKNVEEEAHCLEIALERYSHHALYVPLKNQTIFRLQDAAPTQRKAFYSFALLTVRYLSKDANTPIIQSYFAKIENSWESLYFLNDAETLLWPEDKPLAFITRLCFWLNKSEMLNSIIDEMLSMNPTPLSLLTDALFALVEMRDWELVQQKLDIIVQNLIDIQAIAYLDWIHEAILPHLTSHAQLSSSFLASLPKKLETQHLRTALHIFYEALQLKQTELIYQNIAQLKRHELTAEQHMQLDEVAIWAHLLDRNWPAAQEILDHYPKDRLLPDSLLFFLYGCWLRATQGKESALHHFSILKPTQFPPSWTLFCDFFQHEDRKQAWLSQAFVWEKNQLSRQAALFDHCDAD